MKKLLFLLFALLLVSGCGEKTQGRAEMLQQRYAALNGYETHLRVVIPREEETLAYTLYLTRSEDCVRAEVEAPAELAGVAATMTGSALTLEYDGMILDAGTLSPHVRNRWIYRPEAGRAAAAGELCTGLSEQLRRRGSGRRGDAARGLFCNAGGRNAFLHALFCGGRHAGLRRDRAGRKNNCGSGVYGFPLW